MAVVSLLDELVTTYRIHISVWSGRALVRRFHILDGGTTIGAEIAANWDALEPEAIAAVHAQGGALNLSGVYRCPVNLAAFAVWEDAP